MNTDTTPLPTPLANLHRFRQAHPYRRETVQGISWEYIASGQGHDAVLLLGGGLSVGESAFRTVNRLEPHYRVVSPSYPAAGRMAAVTDGLAGILDKEGIAQTHVYGHSLGAAVAHAFIRRHPARVDRLALSGFGIYSERHTRQMKHAVLLLSLLPVGVTHAIYIRKFRRLLADVDAGTRAFVLAHVQDLFATRLDKAALMGQFKLLTDLLDNAGINRAYQPIERPGRVLIIEAEDDSGFTAEEQTVLKALYPGAKVHVFASGGHLAGITRQDEYETVLDGFLRGDDDPDSP